MEVAFPEDGFSVEDRDEIDDTLHRISVNEEAGSNKSGEWRNWPDRIEILRRLSGGRSGSEVLEVVVKRGNHEARRVIKLGPGRDLENEFKAFDAFLRDASALFVPIEAATPVALGRDRPRRGEREAVVYDHAARFQGMPQNQTRTFEEIAHEAIQRGGAVLEKAVKSLETLFDGIHNDLYDKNHVYEQEPTLQKSWNRRLGIDAVVAIDRVDSASKKLETSYHPLHGAEQKTFRPRGIANASVRVDGEAAKGDILQVSGARMTWQGDSLVAEEDAHSLRIEVVADTRLVYQLTSLVEEGSRWLLRGQLVSLRMETHRERLLKGLSGDFKLADGILIGPDARVRDPFAALSGIIESSRPHRITSIIHGDLNPRNILISGENPCLIDYALTGDGEPILMDFTRLEGCLARDVLPDDLSWAQHVRLQRLLAAACRLGDEAARRFVERLATERAELASAFRLLWTIRRAARDLYPKDYQEQWVRDYLEQLFLFAHLTLKWDGKDELVPQKLRATTAMAGVAAEALTNTDIYEQWSKEALREDGGEIIQVIQSRPETFLSELANLARVWPRLDTKLDAILQDAFEHAREGFVKRRFCDAANAAINRLNDDHDVYISLKAYINLKGQLRTGYQRHRRPVREMLEADELPSFEKMLETDELLAESEFLRLRPGSGEDVLHLIARNTAVVLIGDAGSGKSTVAREWEYRLARSIVDRTRNIVGFEGNNSTGRLSQVEQTGQPQSTEEQDDSPPIVRPRMPIVLRAPDLPERLQNWDVRNLQSTISILRHNEHDIDLLTIGALYIIVDALNELADEQKKRVASWIIALRNAFPSTLMLVCHRQYNYVPDLLPFPVVTMQKIEIKQARRYIYDYLHEKDVPNHEQLAQRLVSLLLDDPDYAQIRDLAQTPLFLWMIVEHYRETEEVPQSRGSLFETFSRWYLEQRYHKAHQEMTRTRYSYEDKALLLGALGYELVQRRETNLPEKNVHQFVPRSIKNHWLNILEEIITAEMLYRDGKYLRFLHQSFQEYFAARHFLSTQAKDSTAIRRKVSQFGWHDTFAMLLGFAGDTPEVVTRVIEEALKINPILTARCLRMAEQPDPLLLERFVASQESILKDALAGEFAHQRAAEALAEYGRDQARVALWRVAINMDAPEMARVEALKRLAAMPAQVRFEPVKERIRQELESNLRQVFDEPAPVAVQQAAIDAIITAQLRNLGAYLVDLVATGEWSSSRTAWEACNKLGLKLTRGQQAAFINVCRERFDRTEEEIFRETVSARMQELNAERVDIIQQLATLPNLPLLLKRRFSYGISDEVGKVIDQLMQMDGEPPEETKGAWKVLTEGQRVAEDAEAAIDHWLERLSDPDDLTAIAAAHRLMQLGKESFNERQGPFFDLDVPPEQLSTTIAAASSEQINMKLLREKLCTFFNPSLPPERLSVVAHLVRTYQDESFIGPLEALIRSLMETVTTAQEFEAFANLIETLKAVDSGLGNRLAVVANKIFWNDRAETVYCLYYPWRAVSISVYLQAKDFHLLLAAGGNDAQAAVFILNSYGVSSLLDGKKNENPTELDATAMQQLQNLARSEQDPSWQCRFARAAVEVHALELLPWLIDLAQTPEMAKERGTYYDYQYGVFEELYLGYILRAIGYLARILLDKKRADQANPAVTFLRERYVSLQPDEERSIVVGLTTGLGYLGDWEPILTHLGPGEPWMHQAAQNVFEYWVPTPLNKASVKKQREEAAIWIARRLRVRSDLSPQARSTLERIKDSLETKLGRHVRVDDI